jgi:Leu/Phe-tRNA-protein transferase
MLRWWLRHSAAITQGAGSVGWARGEVRWREQRGKRAFKMPIHLLHELGFAHSAETWADGELVGGLYGVSLWRRLFWRIHVYLAS